MPEVVQTGTSVAIDFLGGFGRGMVQADRNRREKEKHEIQKQKWQQEMSAYAAQDELRRLQNENSRLEIDMRKTQYDDLVARKEQTKGFVSFMADAIGKAKGNPAEKQSQLLEAYTNGAAQFTMADRSIGDKFIDIYSKIANQSTARKAWKIVDVKDFDTGTKRRGIVDEGTGDIMNFIPGNAIRDKAGNVVGYKDGIENLDIVNEIITEGTEEFYGLIDQNFQAFMLGKGAVVGAESQMMSFDDFMASVADDDKRTKADRAMDWIFETRTRLLEDAHNEYGTLEQFLGRRLKRVIHNDKAREEIVKSFAGKPDNISHLAELIEETPLEDRAEIFAKIADQAEALLPSYDLPEIKMELARLQNKTALAMRDKALEDEDARRAKKLAMAKQVKIDKARAEEEAIDEYMEAHGTTTVGRELKKIGKGLVGAHKTARDWWDSFLAGQPESLWPDREAEAREAIRAKQQGDVETESAMDTLRLFEEREAR